MPATAAYYIVYPPGHGDDPRIRAFRDWVQAEIAAMPDTGVHTGTTAARPEAAKS